MALFRAMDLMERFLKFRWRPSPGLEDSPYDPMRLVFLAASCRVLRLLALAIGQPWNMAEPIGIERNSNYSTASKWKSPLKAFGIIQPFLNGSPLLSYCCVPNSRIWCE